MRVHVQLCRYMLGIMLTTPFSGSCYPFSERLFTFVGSDGLGIPLDHLCTWPPVCALYTCVPDHLCVPCTPVYLTTCVPDLTTWPLDHLTTWPPVYLTWPPVYLTWPLDHLTTWPLDHLTTCVPDLVTSLQPAVVSWALKDLCKSLGTSSLQLSLLGLIKIRRILAGIWGRR